MSNTLNTIKTKNMKKSGTVPAVITALFFVGSFSTARGQTLTIGSGMHVMSGGMHVTVGADYFVNNGTYTDTLGAFYLLNGVYVSGSGTTTLNDLNIKYPGSSALFSPVSVRNTAKIALDGDLNTYNNLILRSDISPTANLVINGVLNGNVQGIVNRPTATSGPCPMFASDMYTNVSGVMALYQWQWSADGAGWTDIAGATNATYSANVMADKYYRCNLSTTNSPYTEMTPTVQLTLTGVPDAVTVTGTGTHCGQTTITASGGTGGVIYYEGSMSSGTSTTYAVDTAHITSNGTYYFRSLSPAGCWGKQDSAIVVINPILTPAITLTAAPGQHLCKGTLASFGATPVNEGTSPVYQWYVNSVPVGTGDLSYSYLPTNGDEVKILMISNAPCTTVPTANSTVSMLVDDLYVPVVTISASATTIQPGETVTLKATATDAGPSPSYQWYKNNDLIAGANTSTYISDKFADNDSVTCVVTSSGFCAYSSFNSVKFSVKGTGIRELTSGGNIGIIPNPNNGSFVVRGTFADAAIEHLTLQVTNVLGQVVYSRDVKVTNGSIDEQVTLPDAASGAYVLGLVTDNDRAAYHVVISK